MTARYWTGARRQLVPKAQGTRAYIYSHVGAHEGMYLRCRQTGTLVICM